LKNAITQQESLVQGSTRWFRIALLAAFVLIWFGSLAGRSLVSTDEGRYASLSLAMLQSGDWITPRLNGFLYFEKPPLQYWAGAVAMAVLGLNEFAARLWTGLSGFATVLLVGFTASRLWGKTAGVHAALIAGATTWIVLGSHVLTLDAGLTAALTLVLCAVLLAENPATVAETARRRWMLLAWVGMALAVLSKGLIGVVIPAATIVMQSLWRRDGGIWRRLQYGRGILIFLLITAPWFVAVSARNPDFASFFFIHEHLQRYLTTVHHREGAWWYFVPLLVFGFMPWTSGLPWVLRAQRSDFASTFLLVWAVFSFVFFSASSSKLPTYILPIFPALALLLARLTANTGAAVMQRHLTVPTGIWLIGLIASPFVWRLTVKEAPVEAIHALAIGLAVAAVIFFAGAFGANKLLRRQNPSGALAVVAGAHVVALLVLVGSYESYGQLRSSDRIARVLAPIIDRTTPIYAVREYDQTLPFYLRRSVVLVDYHNEFEFGQVREPDRWIPTIDAFAERWRVEPRAVAYTTHETLTSLRALGLEMRVVFDDPRRVVVIKP
jgi:4-amino-4-deoxy-L-arabinose transferase-like glycosyltransferase